MRFRAVSIALALLCTPALVTAGEPEADIPAAAPGGPSADAIADRIQAFYDKTQTFQAEFTQRYTIKAYNRTKDSRGKVIFEKPGKMSWRYSTNANRVVADGKTLRVYEDENKQMYEQPMDQSQYPAALSFLSRRKRKKVVVPKPDAERAKFRGFVLVGSRAIRRRRIKRSCLRDAKTSQCGEVALTHKEMKPLRLREPGREQEAPAG
jgi:outer membrane lipoprotein carrier protein